jgi:hypothetical protein
MTDLQKFAWTIAFGGLYLIAGIRACNWLTSQLGDLNVAVQFLMLPVYRFVDRSTWKLSCLQALEKRLMLKSKICGWSYSSWLFVLCNWRPPPSFV